jgi:hypothetical protein
MKHFLDTKDMEFQAGGPFTARTERDGSQRRDKETGLPLWSVSLVVWAGEEARGSVETILVTVASDNPPQFNQMEFVDVTRLQIIPWVPNDGPKSVRIAYRAESVQPVKQGNVKAVS